MVRFVSHPFALFPSQLPKPGKHCTGQVPFTQVGALAFATMGQTFPQPPQLFKSVAVAAQALTQHFELLPKQQSPSAVQAEPVIAHATQAPVRQTSVPQHCCSPSQEALRRWQQYVPFKCATPSHSFPGWQQGLADEQGGLLMVVSAQV
jgi:hypothetical protein